MRFRNLKKQSQKQKQQSKTTKVILSYARYTDRIKAFITDMFMIYAPILYIITYLFLGGKEEFQSSDIAPFIGVSLYGVIYAFLVSRFGQTPGKKAYTIKVVDNKTQKNIGFFRAIIRFVAFLFTATTLLGLFLPFYRKDNRALHDLICNTVVIALKE
jgi:uncharacterized RDD family membrane protein YckC